jgi:hypothetical protein
LPLHPISADLAAQIIERRIPVPALRLGDNPESFDWDQHDRLHAIAMYVHDIDDGYAGSEGTLSPRAAYAVSKMIVDAGADVGCNHRRVVARHHNRERNRAHSLELESATDRLAVSAWMQAVGAEAFRRFAA